jgi:hypothetical protein
VTLNALRAMRYSGNRVTAMGDSITTANGTTTANQQPDSYLTYAYVNSGGRMRWGGMPGRRC